MLKNKRQNFHHSKLPNIGDIVTVAIDIMCNHRRRYRKFRVEAFPLCDSPQYRGRFMSLGIHTCIISALDNGEIAKMSGHLLVTNNY
jgi:hypothetical protein